MAFAQAVDVLLRYLQLRNVIEPGRSGNIEEDAAGVILIQKLQGKSRAIVRFPRKHDDDVGMFRVVLHQDFSGIRCEDKRCNYEDDDEDGLGFCEILHDCAVVPPIPEVSLSSCCISIYAEKP